MKTVLTMTILFVLAVASSATASDSLHGSRRALARQNIVANQYHLTRLKERQIPIFKRKHLIVPLPVGKNVRVNRRLVPAEYRYVRPWTRAYVACLGKDFRDIFGKPLVINSATRSIEYQRSLRHRNGNAAKATSGLSESSHLTGSTVDIAKKGMTHVELGWMRTRLRRDNRARFVQATEEFRQPVFHVMVFPPSHEHR